MTVAVLTLQYLRRSCVMLHTLFNPKGVEINCGVVRYVWWNETSFPLGNVYTYLDQRMSSILQFCELPSSYCCNLCGVYKKWRPHTFSTGLTSFVVLGFDCMECWEAAVSTERCQASGCTFGLASGSILNTVLWRGAKTNEAWMTGSLFFWILLSLSIFML